MKHHFHDIRDRIADPPVWWDENGTPRWSEFGPNETANIYADECVLLLVQCQECGTPFRVCISDSTTDRAWRGLGLKTPIPSLAERIKNGTIHYGDPPNACPKPCTAGSTMNSVPVRVLEYWHRGSDLEKVRVAELERDVWPDWMPKSVSS